MRVLGNILLIPIKIILIPIIILTLAIRLILTIVSGMGQIFLNFVIVIFTVGITAIIISKGWSELDKNNLIVMLILAIASVLIAIIPFIFDFLAERLTYVLAFWF